MKVTKTECGVWVTDIANVSAARLIACEVMKTLGMDEVNDFRTRDKIIVGISPAVGMLLDGVETPKGGEA